MASPSRVLPSVATVLVEEDLLSPATLAPPTVVMSPMLLPTSATATKPVSAVSLCDPLEHGLIAFALDSGGDGGKAISGSATGGNAWKRGGMPPPPPPKAKGGDAETGKSGSVDGGSVYNESPYYYGSIYNGVKASTCSPSASHCILSDTFSV